MIAVELVVRLLDFSLASNGPSTHVARHHCEPQRQRGPFLTPITPLTGSFFHAETQRVVFVRSKGEDDAVVPLVRCLSFASSAASAVSGAPPPLGLIGVSGRRLRRPVPWHQFIDAHLRPSVHEACQLASEIDLGIGAIELAVSINDAKQAQFSPPSSESGHSAGFLTFEAVFTLSVSSLAGLTA
jgi:hypothetical protein